MSECNFSLEHYFKTLELAQHAGYEIGWDSKKAIDLREAESPRIELVHDVDFSLQPALVLAESEAKHGVCSYYFFRLFADGYNLLSGPSIRIVKQVAALGHKIGFHLESLPGVVAGSVVASRQLSEELEQNLAIVERTLGFKISYVNLHEPARTGISNKGVPPELDYSYSSNRFTLFRYLSDSSGRWREGCFCQWIGGDENLLVLTHPIWWFSDCPSDSY